MSNRSVLLERHQTATERAEERVARRVAAAYRKARQELVDKLLQIWPGGEMTPEQAAATARRLNLVRQIDDHLLRLERDVGGILRDLVTASSEQALNQIEQQIALLPPNVRPDMSAVRSFATINERMIEQFVPVALGDVQFGTRALTLQLQREIQTGLIQGASFDGLVKRLMAATPTGEGPAVWRNGEVSAELAARRLVITAENGSKQAAIGELNKRGAKLQKQAIAAVGKNTTDCCLRVHGQIQPVDRPFELTGTPRFADKMMTPAFHWNCRTSIAMYHPAFEDAMPTSKLREDARKELKQRQEQKASAERTS